MILCVRAVANSNSKDRRKGNRLSLWKDIRKGGDKFTLRANIRIDNGRCIRFWWDSWVGKIKLKDVYPTFFKLSSHKNTIVADLWEGEGVEVDVGRFLLEDPSKIGSKRRTRQLWTMLLTTFGLVWVFPASVRNLLLNGNSRTWEEEKSCLAAGSDLLILVYLGRAQPNDLQRRRIVGPKVEGSLFQIPCGVVQTAGFGDPLSSEFSRVSL
ncbi:hypothetical protein CK203_042933 [Vitis vinifera]|uniref:Reverse transcriptase zinc-binding domain-containing protein n=1 Tax=Vitis vinifera TaxID=29760 RepID=A0A438HUL3_VITVI|nr:hypothetical protein CK203_042933 [Vitis vinifera]